MKKDIFFLILWLLFGVAGVYFIGLTYYVATGLNVAMDVAPWNKWGADEAFFTLFGGIICIYCSVTCHQWYFDGDIDTSNDDETIL